MFKTIAEAVEWAEKRPPEHFFIMKAPKTEKLPEPWFDLISIYSEEVYEHYKNTGWTLHGEIRVQRALYLPGVYPEFIR